MKSLLLERGLEILIDELNADDELRLSFLRNPYGTLTGAADWGMALTDSEIEALRTARYPVWERVAEELGVNLAA